MSTPSIMPDGLHKPVSAAHKPLPLCQYVMPNGRTCRAVRLKSSQHSCYFHAPLALRRSGHSRPAPAEPLPFSSMRGMDEAAVRSAAGQLARRLQQSTGTRARDRIILYALQIALQAMDKSK